MIEPKIVQVFAKIHEGEAPLKAIRDTLGWSQKKLAERLGVTVTTISRWETGRNSETLTIPQIRALDTVLDEVGMRIRDLPDDIGPATKNKQ